MMQSLVNDAAQSGWLPRWPAANDVTYVMGGDSPAILLSSSYAFGAHDFDVETALKYMVKAGTEPGIGPHGGSERPFLADYLKLGYVPVDKKNTAASVTLEYANADFAVAQFARNLGDQDDYQSIPQAIGELDESLRSLHGLDSAPQQRRKLAGWIRPRALPSQDESRTHPPAADQMGFDEGNTYQYTFMIPFDYPTLFAAIGGDDKVIPRLDKFFLEAQLLGRTVLQHRERTRLRHSLCLCLCRRAVEDRRRWSRVSAMRSSRPRLTAFPATTIWAQPPACMSGMRSASTRPCPAWAVWFWARPCSSKVTLRLAGGRTLVVSRQGSGIYVQKVTLNGAPYSSTWLPLAKLHPGITQLQFTTDSQPNKERGNAIADRPPSFR